MLVLVQVSQSILPEESSPADIIRGACHMLEACHFKRVDDTVIGVRTFRYLKSRYAGLLELIMSVLDNPGNISR